LHADGSSAAALIGNLQAPASSRGSILRTTWTSIAHISFMRSTLRDADLIQ
jgi:hypothetical protein